MNRPNGAAADLKRIAEAISDGNLVAWPVEGEGAEPARAVLASLRLIESVARAHRSLAPVSGAAAAMPDPAVEQTLDLPAPAGANEGGTGPSRAGISVGDTWGRLEIRERLGSGSFGDVYRAWDPTLQIEVALKLRRAPAIDAREQARFIDEARRLARVKHGNVLVVHGADEHGGQVGIWTELLRGRTLDEWLAEHGPFGAREAASIGLDLCRALSAIHAAGLVHRDVKAANVMREQGGRYVLMDFGTVVERRPERAAGAVEPAAGTPLYMASETLEGKPATAASDIYALGVLLYFLTSGRFPFQARTMQALIEAHRTGARTPLSDLRPDLPAAFVDVVEHALAADPVARYTSAGAMERALAAAIGLPAPEIADARVAETAGGRRTRLWLAAAAAVVIVGAAIGLGRLGPASARPEVSLMRRGATGVGEALADGARIGVGDKLYVEVEGRDDLYVYVLNQDMKGHIFVLFPGDSDLQNPLSGRTRHRLPGHDKAGQPVEWRVDTAGGTENFLVIADSRPRDDIERYLADLPRPMPDADTRDGALAMPEVEHGETRGVGTVARVAGPAVGADHLAEVSRLATAGARRGGAPWVWRFRLENPPME